MKRGVRRMIERTSFNLISGGIKLQGELLIPQSMATGKIPAVCLCHGIPAGARPAGDPGYLPLAEKLCMNGFATILFNFRGTGLSEGNFDMLGWSQDIDTVMNYISGISYVDKSKLALIAFSGGAAVSVYHSANTDDRIKCLILCACPSEFTFLKSKSDIQKLVEDFRQRGIIRDADFPASSDDWYSGFQRITPFDWVDRMTAKAVIFIHGEQDDLIPVSDAWRLYNKAKITKDILIIGGAGHRLRLNERAMNMAINWLNHQIQVDQT